MTPKQQAEQMARRCASDIAVEMIGSQTKAPYQIILTAIPLEELLEVARAASKASEGYILNLPDSDIGKGQLNYLADAVDKLRNKGIEI